MPRGSKAVWSLKAVTRAWISTKPYPPLLTGECSTVLQRQCLPDQKKIKRKSSQFHLIWWSSPVGEARQLSCWQLGQRKKPFSHLSYYILHVSHIKIRQPRAATPYLHSLTLHSFIHFSEEHEEHKTPLLAPLLTFCLPWRSWRAYRVESVTSPLSGHLMQRIGPKNRTTENGH